MMKNIGARVPVELYDKLQEYKRKRKITSDSEALRDILRNYLLGGS